MTGVPQARSLCRGPVLNLLLGHLARGPEQRRARRDHSESRLGLLGSNFAGRWGGMITSAANAGHQSSRELAASLTVTEQARGYTMTARAKRSRDTQGRERGSAKPQHGAPARPQLWRRVTAAAILLHRRLAAPLRGPLQTLG